MTRKQNEWRLQIHIEQTKTDFLTFSYNAKNDEFEKENSPNESVFRFVFTFVTSSYIKRDFD